jgi:ribosome-associated protein
VFLWLNEGMETYKLAQDYIPLCDLLKVASTHLSGGEAKFVISQGKVRVDGVVELRKKCKIRAGSQVVFGGVVICVV